MNKNGSSFLLTAVHIKARIKLPSIEPYRLHSRCKIYFVYPNNDSLLRSHLLRGYSLFLRGAMKMQLKRILLLQPLATWIDPWLHGWRITRYPAGIIHTGIILGVIPLRLSQKGGKSNMIRKTPVYCGILGQRKRGKRAYIYYGVAGKRYL